MLNELTHEGFMEIVNMILREDKIPLDAPLRGYVTKKYGEFNIQNLLLFAASDVLSEFVRRYNNGALYIAGVDVATDNDNI